MLPMRLLSWCKPILGAATLDNALGFGLAKDLGTIQVGKRADLLLLKEHPLTNVSAYDSIETIFPKGEPIAREELYARTTSDHHPQSGSFETSAARVLSNLLTRALPRSVD